MDELFLSLDIMMKGRSYAYW